MTKNQERFDHHEQKSSSLIHDAVVDSSLYVEKDTKQLIP